MIVGKGELKGVQNKCYHNAELCGLIMTLLYQDGITSYPNQHHHYIFRPCDQYPSKPFILTNALSTSICGECFSSSVIMNQTPELPALCFPICLLTSKCILTSLWDFFPPFLHSVWWKTFGKLAMVPCTLQFVVSIRRLSMKWEGRPQAEGEKNTRAKQNMNRHA